MTIGRNIAVLVLAGLAGMAINANAAAKCTASPNTAFPGEVDLSCALVQTANPPTRAYPGVDPSILGFRTGMTVAQVEALAAKLNLGKPYIESISSRNNLYNATAGKTRAYANKTYVGTINYHIVPGEMFSPIVKIYFSSPATGNRSQAVFVIHGDALDKNLNGLKEESAVVSGLLRQYGPPSYQESAQDDQYLCWNFVGKSLVKAPSNASHCYPTTGQVDTTPGAVQDQAATEFTYGSPLADFYIAADLITDKGKVTQLTQWLGDYQLPRLDHSEAMKQLTSAAAKYNQQAKK